MPAKRKAKKATLAERARAVVRAGALGAASGSLTAYFAYRNRIRRLEDPNFDALDGLRIWQHFLVETAERLRDASTIEVHVHEPELDDRPRGRGESLH